MPSSLPERTNSRHHSGGKYENSEKNKLKAEEKGRKGKTKQILK
jgi:hypothetical protein